MASQPPESIILGSFKGVRNNVSRERLGTDDLEVALNVDIDDAGQLRRRRGYSLKLAGDGHSVYTTTRGVLGVMDGVLGWVRPNFSFQALYAGMGGHAVGYAQVGDDIYFSSKVASGIVRADDSVSPWGVSASAPEWLSPVRSPTDTLGEIAGKLISPPPLATDLDYYKGRIYLGVDRVLWATELYLYNYVDRTRGYLPFETDITLVKAVDDGVYVGTVGGLFFIQGTLADGLKRTPVTDAQVFKGSGTTVPVSRMHPQARQGPVPEGLGVMMMTSDGVYAGFNGGEVYNLTQDRVVFPNVARVAALYREQDGVNQFIAVADSDGTPTSSARIGDYMDAVIVRQI